MFRLMEGKREAPLRRAPGGYALALALGLGPSSLAICRLRPDLNGHLKRYGTLSPTMIERKTLNRVILTSSPNLDGLRLSIRA